jgi:hypothetical protein
MLHPTRSGNFHSEANEMLIEGSLHRPELCTLLCCCKGEVTKSFSSGVAHPGGPGVRAHLVVSDAWSLLDLLLRSLHRPVLRTVILRGSLHRPVLRTFSCCCERGGFSSPFAHPGGPGVRAHLVVSGACITGLSAQTYALHLGMLS